MLRFLLLCVVALTVSRADADSIPDKLVVLTFDDSAKSHFTIVRPLLKKYGFGATFFITEGFDFRTNKNDYMTWQQIGQLHKDGFEIGNHTRDHLGIKDQNADKLAEQLAGIDQQCKQHGIPKPTTFAWPGNGTSDKAFSILKKHGIRFARRGGAPEQPYDQGKGFAYQPGLDHPLLIPSAGDARPDWELDDFITAVQQARQGKIAILQFHGVPDTAHSWVNTPRQKFESYMHYLAINGYQVIALRDLDKYVNADITPQNHMEVINDRKTAVATNRSRDNFRTPQNDQDLQYWLTNMLTHGFDRFEMAAATGLTPDGIQDALEKFSLDQREQPSRKQPGLTLRPYPGGRHPRIGFLDGAMRPQRETKVSVFAPWLDGGYVVADIPEAIWWRQTEKTELLYLAHTHVPTIWDRQGVRLEQQEWTRHADGHLSFERRLPNNVSFGAEVRPEPSAVRMELWISNGTKLPMRDLRVQNCVMLKAASGFDELTDDNKVYASPYAACRSKDGKRWVITAWEHCQRPWGNRRCPCLHSDPQFPDCMPGDTKRLSGWLSFYEGDDLDAEFQRIDSLRWTAKGQINR